MKKKNKSYNCSICGVRVFGKIMVKCRDCGKLLCQNCIIDDNCIDCAVILNNSNQTTNISDIFDKSLLFPEPKKQEW